jgi:hypothetical protein
MTHHVAGCLSELNYVAWQERCKMILSKLIYCLSMLVSINPMSSVLLDLHGATCIARLTLNRPERLNSINAAMRAELLAAIRRVRARRRPCPDPHRRRPRFSAPGRIWPSGSRLPGAPPPDLGQSIEQFYKPLVLALRSPAPAGDRRGQWRGRRRRRQPGARLRHRPGGPLRRLHPGFLQARPGTRTAAAAISCPGWPARPGPWVWR